MYLLSSSSANADGESPPIDADAAAAVVKDAVAAEAVTTPLTTSAQLVAPTRPSLRALRQRGVSDMCLSFEWWFGCWCLVRPASGVRGCCAGDVIRLVRRLA